MQYNAVSDVTLTTRANEPVVDDRCISLSPVIISSPLLFIYTRYTQIVYRTRAADR